VIQSRDVVWLGIYFKDFGDDEGQESESDLDSDSEDENEDLETTTNESKEPVEVSALRTTQSGVRFAPVDESILNKKDENRKVYREMKRLSSSFNPEANRAVDTLDKSPILKQDALEDEKLGRDVNTVAIDHLFGDLGFFCRASFVREPDIALYSDTTEYANIKSNICNLYIS